LSRARPPLVAPGTWADNLPAGAARRTPARAPARRRDLVSLTLSVLGNGLTRPLLNLIKSMVILVIGRKIPHSNMGLALGSTGHASVCHTPLTSVHAVNATGRRVLASIIKSHTTQLLPQKIPKTPPPLRALYFSSQAWPPRSRCTTVLNHDRRPVRRD
jgi:hypothetical protein